MLNNCTIQGRLTKEIVLRLTASEHTVTKFTLACERDFKAKNGERECDWIEVTAWGSTAEFAYRNFHKGDMMIVQGRMETRSYEDSSGIRRKAAEVKARELYFCSSRKHQEEENTGNWDQNKPQDEGFTFDEDMPFA